MLFGKIFYHSLDKYLKYSMISAQVGKFVEDSFWNLLQFHSLLKKSKSIHDQIFKKITKIT
ncbi:hypothetical protein P872_03435 [Rhodonellum psychrophilum GCM71 = DSM 17998]|uniref:Uncharacterized protein n=1 Tax=Rhodonellum psychrophilum GCM71 = DSM 17998 TaxID=1123057 RepID=U5BS75_9BACT|nr:hypothetical protein P872_03435 [Rhodonellum psychrophilum GCM71 = DSM 17998]